MSGMARFITIAGLVLLATSAVPASARVAAQPTESAFDIANVPLAVSDLQEPGYQIMSGGYLDFDAAARWIAEPRMRSSMSMADELSSSGWVQGYALDLVLLEDRAYADSDILSLVQTNIFLFSDDDGAEDMYDVMADYSGSDDAEDVEPSVDDSTTVHLVSESGDSMRTVFQRDRTIVEVVTLEGFGFVDPEDHSVVVEATLNRLGILQGESGPGISSRAVRLEDGESLADLQNFQQSGVHHLYRIRDGVTQPAVGEVQAPAPEEIAEGMMNLYLGSEALSFDNGTGYMSTWIGEFDSEASAAAVIQGLGTGNPSALTLDQYFLIAADEQATSQGIEGVYRVTGLHNGQTYSGSLEIRQQENFVVAIGFRAVGSALPPVDVTSRVMDLQLVCLQDVRACPPVQVSELFVAPSATPVVPQSSTDTVLSEEFGWSVQPDPLLWTVTEQFSEPGYDFVEMQSDRSLVSFESVIDQHGDPQQCVIDELRMLQELEGSAVIDLGSDVADENPAGSVPGHAWAIYTVEPLADERADQEYTIRIDCYTIVEGGADLVVTHRAPRDLWAGEREKGNDLRDSIQLPNGNLAGGIIVLTTHNWRCDVINKTWIDNAA
jgi:hypothetical protein